MVELKQFVEPTRGKVHDCRIKQLRWICDERGRLMEMLRSDDDLFVGYGMSYVTTMYPGVTKAWHYHRKQTDHFVCVKGMIKLVLYDARDDSPSKGVIQEIFLGESNQILVQIPPNVWHGFKNIGIDEAMVVNTPTHPYQYTDPDEYRAEAHGEIPYDWARKDG